ncbi:adenylate cyclase regulatory domain-containing protein [Mycobacterium sp. C31M]
MVPVDLLAGLKGDARRDRSELIGWLLDRGFTVEQIRQSDTPMLLPANRVMGEDGVYVSERQVAVSSGVELELLRRLQHAAGLPRIDDPDAAVLHRVDAEAAAAASYFIDFGLDVDDAIAVVRVLMEGLSHTAALLRDTSFKIWTKPGATEIELAQSAEALTRDAAPRILSVVQGLLLMQMRRMFEAEGIGSAERAAGELSGARMVAVAFADLSGFTPLGEVVAPEDLARVASVLSDLAHDVVTAPVRFVKTIGDAVMLVSPEPYPLVETLIVLLDEAAGCGLPPMRGGVTMGRAVSRAGDWFGSPVNVASRVVGLAEPGSVLVAEPARELIGDVAGLVWNSIGRQSLRGVAAEVELFRVDRDREGQGRQLS